MARPSTSRAGRDLTRSACCSGRAQSATGARSPLRPVRRQVEVVRVEQVDEAVGGKRAVDGYAEQPAVPVAVHPPRDVEDRGCRARPWLHHLEMPFLRSRHPPVGRPAMPTGLSGRDRPLLESGRIRRGARRIRCRADEHTDRQGGEEWRAKRVCSASPGPSRVFKPTRAVNTQRTRVNAETASADILRRAWR